MAKAVIFAFETAVAMLGAQAAGRFNVKGYQTQKKAAETIIDNVLVQCWVDSADVDWNRSSRNGPKVHECRIGVRFTAAQPAKADVATLENPASTDAERATALSNLTSPDIEATNALYGAWSAVFEIFDDARNLTFGLPEGSISDKAYSNFQQDEFQPRGGAAIVTATSFLEFRVKEAQLGAIPNKPEQVTNETVIQGAGHDGQIDGLTKQAVKAVT